MKPFFSTPPWVVLPSSNSQNTLQVRLSRRAGSLLSPHQPVGPGKAEGLAGSALCWSPEPAPSLACGRCPVGVFAERVRHMRVSLRSSSCVCVCVRAHTLSCVQRCIPHGLQPASLLHPWDSPGKNTGVGCHGLLQGIFLTKGSNLRLLRLLHWQSGCLSPGKPRSSSCMRITSSPERHSRDKSGVMFSFPDLLCGWLCSVLTRLLMPDEISGSPNASCSLSEDEFPMSTAFRSPISISKLKLLPGSVEVSSGRHMEASGWFLHSFPHLPGRILTSPRSESRGGRGKQPLATPCVTPALSLSLSPGTHPPDWGYFLPVTPSPQAKASHLVLYPRALVSGNLAVPLDSPAALRILQYRPTGVSLTWFTPALQ